MEYKNSRRDYDHDDRDSRGGSKRKFPPRRKVCRFCTDKEFVANYKNPRLLSLFVSDRGRIIPSRISGNCATHQRDVTTEVKRARSMALLPFTSTQV